MKERGSASLEMAVITPVLLATVLLAVFAGRVALAHQSADLAASSAARAASLERTATNANKQATQIAATTMAGQGLTCSSLRVTTDTSGFAKPVGTPATVQTHIECQLNLSDLTAPGIPGSITIQAQGSSPIDTYRGRG